MLTAARSPGKPRYHHGDLRRALVRAGLGLIAAKGPRGFTLREAARRVGVTHAAPYRHFSSRAELLAAVAHEGFRELAAAIERAAAGAARPLQRMERAGLAYVRFAIEHPGHFRVMFGAEAVATRDPALQQAKNRAYGFLVGLIESCQSQGLVRAGPSRDMALTVWVALHGLGTLLVDRSPRLERTHASPAALARRVMATLSEGMAPRGERARSPSRPRTGPRERPRTGSRERARPASRRRT